MVKEKDSSNLKSSEKESLYYGSNPLVNGANIRQAISGEKMCYKIGDNSELNMFRVMNVTGFKQESVKYYYTNPEQYEKANEVTLPACVKNNWLKRTIQ